MTKQHAVVIAGGGPTGLMLAAELALAKVDVVVVERRADQSLPGSRAGGLHARSLELLDQRGVVERFTVQGKLMQIVGFATTPLDMSDFPTRHNHGLALWQEPIERTLAAWVDELAVPVLRSCEVTGFTQRDDGVDVTLSDGSALRAAYLVGCDGGRSLIRKLAGIDFAGHDASVSYLIAEASMRDEPALGMRHGDRGVYGISRLNEGEGARERVRVVLIEPDVHTGEPSDDELRAALVAFYGSDFGLHDVTWLSRFSDMTRQAVAYRAGRVLLAGDAAHVHSPTGGQGLNLGLHDAVNLGFKLALVVNGHAPASLLDTYEAERHAVAARALRSTMAQTALFRGDARTKAARDVLAEIVVLDEPRKRLAAMLSGLDIHLDMRAEGAAHALLGRRMPDLDVVTAEGARRVFSFLHRGQPLLLNLGVAGAVDCEGWRDRVACVDARFDGVWELPVIGRVPAPSAVLVRPDGHVAWVGDASNVAVAAVDVGGLRAALTAWFGAPSPS